MQVQGGANVQNRLMSQSVGIGTDWVGCISSGQAADI